MSKIGLGHFDKYLVNGQEFGQFSEAISVVESPKLDSVSVIQLISRYHFFGDRTIEDSIKKTRFFHLDNEIQELPDHGNIKESSKNISAKLYDLLKQEIGDSIEGKKNIGILLSGGMDSRIVAGILRNMQLEGGNNFNVIALTWGIDRSRDVHYANHIARIFGWNWKHYDLNPETLYEAIEVTTLNGAEFSPIHLHAMHKVREEKEIDIILAGSYGDSIGRGEYSGRHITKLNPIDSYIFNWFGLVRNSSYYKAKALTTKDITEYRLKFPRDKEYQYREIERQCHYMRRMLNPCLGVINQKIPIKQIFSDTSVFGFMWSIDPTLRGDEIYEKLLEYLPSDLHEISWARTGKKYGSNNEESDELGVLNNHYGKWIRNELRPIIHDAIHSDVIQGLGIFNEIALNKLYQSQKHFNTLRASKVDEILIWIVSLKRLVESFNISFDENQLTWKDAIRSRLVPIESLLFATMHNKKYKD